MSRTCVAVAAFLCSSTAAAQSGRQLDSLVTQLMRRAEIPGVSVAVVRNGALAWSGAFGVRNAQTREPVDRYTVFDAASLTKTVFSYAVLRLADRGIMDIDKPIADILPNPRMAHDPRYLRITPRHVMSHATGLPNWGGDKLDLAFDPGTSWGYSGEGFVWLSKAVEKLTGISTNALVQREILQPLGMAHSSLAWVDSLEANGAQPHGTWGRVSLRRRPAPDSIDNSNAAASLRTNAEDYAKFVIAAMNGWGLKPATAKSIFAVQNETFNSTSRRDRPDSIRNRIAWGLGWGLERRGERILAWHWGDNGDAKAFVIADPAARTAVMYFANSDNGLSIANALANAVLPGQQAALAWLRWEEYDAPGRIARRVLVHAALDSGVAGAVKQYAGLSDRNPHAVDSAVVRAAAEALVTERLDAADTLLALAGRDFPSLALLMARADMRLQAGADARGAVRLYERAVAFAPSDSTARARLQWSRDVVAALDKPFALAAGTAARFAGAYGPRVVTIENGRLMYQRGTGRKFPLVAMSKNLFTLEGNPIFRAEFVSDGDGPATRIVGWYFDGRRDESPRSP